MKMKIVYLILICFLIGCEKEATITNDTISGNNKISEIGTTNAKQICTSSSSLGSLYGEYNPSIHTFEQVQEGDDLICHQNIPFYITGDLSYPVNNLSFFELELQINSSYDDIMGIIDVNWTISTLSDSGPNTISYGINVGATFPIQCEILSVNNEGCIYKSDIAFEVTLTNSSRQNYLEESEICSSSGSDCYALAIAGSNSEEPCPYTGLPAREGGVGGTFAVIVP